MKTLKQVSVTVEEVKYIPETKDMVEGVIYLSDTFKTASHKCLCGCGELTVTPFHRNGWQLSGTEEKITIRPSIGNFQFKCKSHYIITKGIANFV